MILPITGGCLCGAVRYEINAEPIGAGNCHCRTCQKAVSAPYVPILFVAYKALTISGEFKEFASLSGRGNTIHRAFCPECGSMVCARNSGTDKIRPVSASTLDDPSIYKPQMDFWVSDAQPWDYMNPELPKFEENPLHF